MKCLPLTVNTFLLLSVYGFHSNAQIATEFANTSLGFTTTASVTAPAPEAARLADLDGDGDLDAVISIFSGIFSNLF